MSKTIDQFNDAAFGLLIKQAERMPAFGEFVKQADIESGERETLPATAFAWPEERRFPIHTDKHAALSYAYSLAQPEVPVHVVTRIKEALEVYSVPFTTYEVVTSKVAAEENPWLLPDLKLFPVRTKEDVKTAEFRLINGISKLDLEHRATACSNLVKKAQELGAELHPATLQFAGMVVSSTKFAAEWIDVRANQTKDTAIKQAYAKLASEFRKQGSEVKDRDQLIKLASVIAELDEKAGFTKHYDRKMPDPLLTIFNTSKEAASSVDVNGTMIPLSKLASLGAPFWQDLGGKELSDEIYPGGVCDPAKLAQVIPTLPLDLQVILQSQVR
jgi:hypothetical protein